MSIVEIKVPQLSESVAEATLLTWKKKPGESVREDEIVIEVETDKVVMEVPAPASGVIAEILAADGATVTGSQVIATINTTGQASVAPAAAAAPAPAQTTAAPAAAASKAGIAMPAAAKLMADNNLAAGSVAGTGKDGRVTKGDVLGAVATGTSSNTPAAQLPAVALPAVALPAGARPEERVPMSRLRARIAERLLESQRTNAILTTLNAVNIAPVL